ncbi:hypothetical protein KEM48_000673 [Puccinia striiformis f. sp. tritici PST-130]|nr:hypothetical protein KEM48_000673 [Puccinia striiformis f. sp. tritici PST-130]
MTSTSPEMTSTSAEMTSTSTEMINMRMTSMSSQMTSMITRMTNMSTQMTGTRTRMTSTGSQKSIMNSLVLLHIPFKHPLNPLCPQPITPIQRIWSRTTLRAITIPTLKLQRNPHLLRFNKATSTKVQSMPRFRTTKLQIALPFKVIKFRRPTVFSHPIRLHPYPHQSHESHHPPPEGYYPPQAHHPLPVSQPVVSNHAVQAEHQPPYYQYDGEQQHPTNYQLAPEQPPREPYAPQPPRSAPIMASRLAPTSRHGHHPPPSSQPVTSNYEHHTGNQPPYYQCDPEHQRQFAPEEPPREPYPPQPHHSQPSMEGRLVPNYTVPPAHHEYHHPPQPSTSANGFETDPTRGGYPRSEESRPVRLLFSMPTNRTILTKNLAKIRGTKMQFQPIRNIEMDHSEKRKEEESRVRYNSEKDLRSQRHSKEQPRSQVTPQEETTRPQLDTRREAIQQSSSKCESIVQSSSKGDSIPQPRREEEPISQFYPNVLMKKKRERAVTVTTTTTTLETTAEVGSKEKEKRKRVEEK